MKPLTQLTAAALLGTLMAAYAAPAPSSCDLQQIKTVFVIAMENHNLTQPGSVSSPQPILGNAAAPYLNSLMTPGSSNAVQVSYATRYFNSGVGVHPSEPNYVWQEAASDFGFHSDADPASGANLYTVPHFTAQLNAAGITWKDYQENVSFSTSPQISASGTNTTIMNPYYGNGQYNYAVKHNPMAFFTDTGTKNVYELSQLFTDLTNNAVGRYNWITPNQYDDAHSAIAGSFSYAGNTWTGDQSAIATGDNFLSIVVPQIMASQAYQSNGVIVIWFDETEGGDTTNFSLPEIIISPLAKGNAYNSTLEYSHSSDLKTMEEIYGLSFVSNTIPVSETNVKGAGYNFVSTVNDLSDMFNTKTTTPVPTNAAALASVKDVFVIAMENHNLTQPGSVSSPQPILGNAAAPYLNSLMTPGSSNAVQVSYATRYFNSGVGVHPSEPNYVWQEAASDFGFHSDADPASGANLYTVPHFTAQLNAAGIPWKDYQENVSFSTSPQISASGTNTTIMNPYYGNGQYNYAVKHNPMAFFTDTGTQNVYELKQLFTDLTNNAVGRYNWITPNQYDDAHSAIAGSFSYAGNTWTGDQSAIATGDNFLSIVVPQIMASQAYQSNGVIVIWFDETEGGDTTNFSLPEIIISPLAKGNAYNSTLEYSHSSDLKTMEEIYGLSFVSNTIPVSETNVKGAGYNFVSSVNDLSDMFIGGSIKGQFARQGQGTTMTLSGSPGQQYTVMASDSLLTPVSQWTPIGGGQFSGPTQNFTDTDAPNHQKRFYSVQLK